MTPLLVAAEMGHREAVGALIGFNADLRARDSQGRTASMLARQGRHPDLATALEGVLAQQR